MLKQWGKLFEFELWNPTITITIASILLILEIALPRDDIIYSNILLNAIEKSQGRRVPNMEVLRKHMLREGHLNKPELCEIIEQATNILSKY